MKKNSFIQESLPLPARGSGLLRIILISLILSAMVVIPSCKKGPGPGGKASITGKIYVRDYTKTPPYTLLSSYYAQGENVYIIYGDETGVGKQVKTSYDGAFVFDFLRTGKYKVYSLSRDTTSAANSQTIEVLKNVEISGKKDEVKMDDIVILK